MQVGPARLEEALALLEQWAKREGLGESEGAYVARSPQRPQLRFTRSGDPDLESRYKRHFISNKVSAKKRERLEEKASRAPELLVIVPLNDKWTCHRCGGTGDWLIMEGPGPSCLRCAGLDDLEFLPAGNATLTRRAKEKSVRRAVIVRWARARKRYERQGLLVEKTALADAERELATRSPKPAPANSKEDPARHR